MSVFTYLNDKYIDRPKFQVWKYVHTVYINFSYKYDLKWSLDSQWWVCGLFKIWLKYFRLKGKLMELLFDVCLVTDSVNTMVCCNIWGSHRGVPEDLSLVGLCNVLLGL